MIYFLIYLFLEVIISVKISSSIGGLITFFEIVVSAFVGILILINFRKTVFENISVVSYNFIDLEELQRLNLFTLFGAIFLIVPGFLTDILGILMQFSTLMSILVNRYNVKSGNCNRNYNNTNNLKKDSDVIDVEIISDNTTIK